MNAEPVPDGNLPAALKRLGLAVAALVDPKPHHNEGVIHWVDSLYVQLIEEVPGRQGTGHGVARSLPPLCIDAEVLLTEIDTAVAAWEPRPLIDAADDELPPITVIRLHAIENRGWRPQDVHSIEQISGAVESWVKGIDQLLTPPPKWTLPNPCPACEVAVVYRKDSAGDRVRMAALQLTPVGGCQCMNCRYVWEPGRIRLLAKSLGYELPAGVLE